MTYNYNPLQFHNDFKNNNKPNCKKKKNLKRQFVTYYWCLLMDKKLSNFNDRLKLKTITTYHLQFFIVKSLVVELTPLHVQNAWEFREKMVRTAGLTACCNYLLKK